MTGGRHRAYRKHAGWMISNRQIRDARLITAVLLEDGGWYEVANHSFALCRLRLTFGGETVDLGAGFYFHTPNGTWIEGPITSIRAIRTSDE